MSTHSHTRLSVAAGALVAAVVASAVTAGSAHGSPACEGSLCAAPVAQRAAHPRPYTEPMEALGGRSHAQHLAEHMWTRLLRAGL